MRVKDILIILWYNRVMKYRTAQVLIVSIAAIGLTTTSLITAAKAHKATEAPKQSETTQSPILAPTTAETAPIVVTSPTPTVEPAPKPAPVVQKTIQEQAHELLTSRGYDDTQWHYFDVVVTRHKGWENVDMAYLTDMMDFIEHKFAQPKPYYWAQQVAASFQYGVTGNPIWQGWTVD